MTGSMGESGVALPAEIPPAEVLTAALDTVPEAVLVCDADHTVRFANIAARRLVPDLRPGHRVSEAELSALAAAARAGVDSFVAEHRGRRLSGRRQHVSSAYAVWRLSEGPAPAPAAGAEGPADGGAAAGADAGARTQDFLTSVSRRLAGALNQRRSLRTVAELAVAHLADAAVVIQPPAEPGARLIRLAAGPGLEEHPTREYPLADVPGLVAALHSFPPPPPRRLAPAALPEWALPGFRDRVSEVLLLPLPGTAAAAGALLLVRGIDRAGFSDQDEALAGHLAAAAGAALSAATMYREQVDATAALRAEVAPPDLPHIAGLELAASFQPAADVLVGGDFYDAFPPVNTASPTVVVLGDVCGKGPVAAALTGKVRQTLRALHLVEQDPVRLLEVLNEALLQPGQRGRFLTLVVAAVTRLPDGRHRMVLAAAGHPPPLVLRSDGRVEPVPATGALVGVLPELTVRPAVVDLAPGELCLLYSDGASEARGGISGREPFGQRRLRRALESCHGLPPSVVLERLRQLVSEWMRGGARDDIALLAIQPARASAARERSRRRAARGTV